MKPILIAGQCTMLDKLNRQKNILKSDAYYNFCKAEQR